MLPDPGEVTDPSHCRRFLTPADEASIFTLDHFPLWYRQAAEQPPGSMVFNLYSAEGPGNLHPKLQGGGPGLPSSHRRLGWETATRYRTERPDLGGPSPRWPPPAPWVDHFIPWPAINDAVQKFNRNKGKGFDPKVRRSWTLAQIPHRRTSGQLVSGESCISRHLSVSESCSNHERNRLDSVGGGCCTVWNRLYLRRVAEPRPAPRQLLVITGRLPAARPLGAAGREMMADWASGTQPAQAC